MQIVLRRKIAWRENKMSREEKNTGGNERSKIQEKNKSFKGEK